MAKQEWKAGNLLNPTPVVLVTTRGKEGKDDVSTIAWTGTVCSEPPMLSISVRPSRLTYTYLQETGVFTVNLVKESMTRAADYCGVRSGRDEDKFLKAHLTKEEATHIQCPMIAESPANLECRVKEKHVLGTHTIFIAEILAVHVDEQYIDRGRHFRFNDCSPVVYSHGEYRGIGDGLGKFGFSVKRGRTGGKESPTEARRSPTDAKRRPTEGKRRPISTGRSPSDTRRSPSEAGRSPSDTRRSPSETRRSPSDTKRSPSDTRRSPSDTRRSPSEAGRSLSDTRRSPSEARRSPSNGTKSRTDAPKSQTMTRNKKK